MMIFVGDPKMRLNRIIRRQLRWDGRRNRPIMGYEVSLDFGPVSGVGIHTWMVVAFLIAWRDAMANHVRYFRERRR